MIKITDVQIRKVENAEKLLAVANIVIDDSFAVHDIKIIKDDSKDGYFITMPSRKIEDGTFKDIAHAINTPTREYILKEVKKAYVNAIK